MLSEFLKSLAFLSVEPYPGKQIILVIRAGHEWKVSKYFCEATEIRTRLTSHSFAVLLLS